MNETPDTIVVGLGGMGSAALYHLARRGHRVLGIERFQVPHEMGSSHGLTRIIRLAYFEHPDYVPLLRRSYDLWHRLEEEAGEPLLIKTGSLDVSQPDVEVFQGSLHSCRLHGILHEVLTEAEVGERFPGYRLEEGMMAVYQPDGGFLLPERCIVRHVEGARAAGASVHTEERVTGWEQSGGGVRVTTERGSYEAGALILAAGAWTGALTDLGPKLAAERQVLVWTEPLEPDLYTPDRFPVFNFRGSLGHFYGFPQFQVPGVKVGKYHHLKEVVDPDDMDRAANDRDEGLIREFVEAILPRAAGPTSQMKACLFTNTPDEHFIIDWLPGSERVVVGAGFSGHGFKFASAVGDILAGMAAGEGRPQEAEFLSLDRWAEGASD